MPPNHLGRLRLAACCALAIAATAATAASAQGSLENLDVRRHTLDNGLRVVLNPDPRVPTVAIAVYYDVGSRDEEPGRSGFAHLFEHMMFQGSENVGKAEHFTLINSRGGSANGTTSQDRTNYYETLPSNELALGLWLEADRMRSLAVTAENFENQRQTVMEERRQRIDNQPYVPAFLRIDELVYGDYFPYAHSVIGDMQDLERAPLEAVQAFFDAYYAPNNAVLSIAGDFDPDEALRLVEAEFGDIPRRERPAYEPPRFEPRDGELRETLADPNAPLPALLFSYPIPPMRTPDHYALEMLTVILGDGESARLNQLLVKKKEIAASVSAFTDDRRGPDTFSIWAVVAGGADPAEVEATLERELGSIAKKGIPARELEKAKNRLRAHFVFALERNLVRAKQLAEHELYWGDANLLKSALEPYLAVTSEDIARVASEYLVRDRKTLLEVRPAEPSEPSADAAEEESR